MTNLIPIFILLAGAVIGASLAWLVLNTKIKRSFKDGQADSATQIAAINERIAAKEHEVLKLQQALDKQTGESSSLRNENAQLKANLEGERRAAAERSESFKQAAEALSEKFKALSRDALKDNNHEFLNLARVTLEKFQVTAKGDLEQRQQAIDQVVKPLKESLEKVDGKIEEMERLRAGAYSGLIEQVKTLAASQQQLQSETGNLVKALRTPHVRGRWGEIQLRRVVELAGMVQYCDFVEQETVTTETGRLRPDLIVRLPGGKKVVVDSKAPSEAYFDAMETTDENVRRK